MYAATKGTITLKYLQIPITLHLATENNKISLHQLHKDDLARIRMSKVCSLCGEMLTSKDIVKGYELEMGHDIPLSEVDLAMALGNMEKNINILDFVPAGQIPTICYNKTYYTLPQVDTDGRAYELLRRCMDEEDVVAMAQGAIGKSPCLMALFPTQSGILVKSLHYPSNVRPMPESPEHPHLTDTELELGRTLIKKMKKTFEESNYQDEYRNRLLQVIEARAANRTPKLTNTESLPSSDDLLSALKKSI